MRHNLGLDHVPAGVADKKASTDPGDDNIIYDITNGVSASGFGHPECSAAATAIGKALPRRIRSRTDRLGLQEVSRVWRRRGSHVAPPLPGEWPPGRCEV